MYRTVRTVVLEAGEIPVYQIPVITAHEKRENHHPGLLCRLYRPGSRQQLPAPSVCRADAGVCHSAFRNHAPCDFQFRHPACHRPLQRTGHPAFRLPLLPGVCPCHGSGGASSSLVPPGSHGSHGWSSHQRPCLCDGRRVPRGHDLPRGRVLPIGQQGGGDEPSALVLLLGTAGRCPSLDAVLSLCGDFVLASSCGTLGDSACSKRHPVLPCPALSGFRR